ncbi:MAG: hypothetical protein H6611_05395 [Ignavibacteriales bacterium]|nr:hypothetical protein [Ignavibacteriales bacterium]
MTAQKIDQINPDELVEIENLIVDETISKMGSDFYDVFYTSWEVPANSPNFNMVIKEKPYPGRGNLISIEINDQLVFNRFVTPRYDEIVETASLAVKTLQNYLISYQEIQEQLNGEDLIGSGIF